MRFYVYELVDPRNDRVFYVGKGCGKRDYTTLFSGTLRKMAAVRAIKDAGLEVICRRIAEGLYEREAYKLERDRIAHHGVANLTNYLPGSRTEKDRLIDLISHHLDRLCRPPDDSHIRRKLFYIRVKIQMLRALLDLKEEQHAGAR